MKIGVWEIEENIPNKLNKATIDLEKHLEDWIENDPSLLQFGLEIVGRQVTVEAGYIDLLAIDSQGRWIVIEIKRGQLDRNALAQVIDYASCISSISDEELISKTDSYLKSDGKSIKNILNERSAIESLEQGRRDVELVVVGVGKMAGIERMANYLSDKFQVPISIVTYDVFQKKEAGLLLVRELSESDYQPRISKTKSQITVAQIYDLADSAGVGVSFRALIELATELGLYLRPYKKSVMITPPFQRNRMLFTVWAEKQNNGIKMYAGPAEFVEFYPVNEEEASSFLGLEYSGWQNMDDAKVKEFIGGVRKLFDLIEERNSLE